MKRKTTHATAIGAQHEHPTPWKGPQRDQPLEHAATKLASASTSSREQALHASNETPAFQRPTRERGDRVAATPPRYTARLPPPTPPPPRIPPTIDPDISSLDTLARHKSTRGKCLSSSSSFRRSPSALQRVGRIPTYHARNDRTHS